MPAAAYQDDLGREVSVRGAPRRVVSLAPGATESLCAIGIGDSLKGITTDDSYFECLIGKEAVGPAAAPDWGRVLALKPDLLLLAAGDLAAAEAATAGRKIPIIAWDDNVSPEAAQDRILRLGALFGKTKEAKEAVAESQDFLDTIRLKAAKIPEAERLRVLRLRALPDGGLGTCGSASGEAATIRAAGGVPPALEGAGTVPLDGKALRAFDPQFAYACADDRAAIEAVKGKSPWSGSKALKSVHYYPCQLTDHPSAHAGYFVAWLSSDLYADSYGDPANFVLGNAISKRTPVAIKGIPYVKDASVVEYKLFDFPHRTLLINFASPQDVVSTGDGAPWKGVTAVGNSGSPPMAWGIHHKNGWESAQATLYDALGVDRDKTSLIFTGADLRALAVRSASFKDLRVTALATAGVDGNAIRTSKDKGAWFQPGTINVVLLTNRTLSPTGAASAIIVATEAKTAALWDMDVRSAETPKENPATGTGTDDIIVVQGSGGNPLDYTGGHSKIGELIARVVYDAVVEAVAKQNGKGKVRPVWLRLAERGIVTSELGPDFQGKGALPGFEDEFMKLLLEERPQALLEAAFALDDAAVMGEYSSIRQFRDFAAQEASGIAGRDIGPVRQLVTDKGIPPALAAALDALGSALLARNGL
jgi:adenosylcobinamide amidohydrolase/ABC-type Fe3+-hydroxamate transport system substrate-binding protein